MQVKTLALFKRCRAYDNLQSVSFRRVIWTPSNKVSGNLRIDVSFKNLFHHSQLGAPQEEKNPGALGTCPVCPLVKTALEQRTLQFYLAPVLPPDATNTARQGNSFSFVKLIIVRQLLTVLVSVMMATFMQTTRRELSYRRSSVQSLSSPSSLRFNSLGKSRYNLFYYAVRPSPFWNSAIRPSVCPMAQLPRL